MTLIPHFFESMKNLTDNSSMGKKWCFCNNRVPPTWLLAKNLAYIGKGFCLFLKILRKLGKGKAKGQKTGD